MLTMRTGVQPSDLEDLIVILRDAEEDDERTRAALTNRAYQTYTGWLDGRLVGAAVVEWRPGLDSEILYIAVTRTSEGTVTVARSSSTSRPSSPDTVNV